MNGDRGQRSARAKLWLTTGALFAGLAVAEGVARLPPRPLVGTPGVEGAVVAASADAELRFENVPLAEQWLVYPQHEAPDARVLARVNEQGFRGPALPLARRPGVARIAAIGDSHTFGHGVADDETWAAVVEHRLATPSVPVEVMNCGVNGYDADQVFTLLRKRVLDYAPDLVLYGFFCNDAALASSRLASVTRPDRAPDADASSGALGWLRARSRLVEAVADSLHRRTLRARSAERQAALYDEESLGWQRLRTALADVNEHLRSRGTRFAVVLVPLLVPSGSGLLSSASHREMSGFCAANGIHCLDLEPYYGGRNLDALRVHEFDLHAGAEAHRIAGEAVAEWLRELELLEGSSTR